MNVIEIEERIDEMLGRGFKPADFIFDFIEAYGAPKSVIKQLRGGQKDTFGQAPVLWKRNVHFQHASEGQVGRVLTALTANKATGRLVKFYNSLLQDKPSCYYGKRLRDRFVAPSVIPCVGL